MTRGRKCLMRLRAVPEARGTIVFVPPVLGSSSPYLALAQAIPTCDSFGLFAPGMLDGSPVEESLGALLDVFFSAVAERDWPLPLFLAGWSVGAAQAPVLARELSAAGLDVRHVFLFDPPLPSEQPKRRGELHLYRALTAELLAILDRVEEDGSWQRGEWPTPEVATLLDTMGAPYMGRENPARMRRLATVQAAQKAAFADFRFRPYAGSATLLTADHGDDTDAGIAEWAPLLPCADVVVVGGSHSSFVVEDPTRLEIARHVDSVVSARCPG